MKKLLCLGFLFMICLTLCGCISLPSSTSLFSSFTKEESTKLKEYYGFEIPFLKTKEYELEDNFYNLFRVDYMTKGNTRKEFLSYKDEFDKVYSYDREEVDCYNISWYVYTFQTARIYLSCYLSKNSQNIVEVLLSLKESENPRVSTNLNKSLPEGTNGVYDVDFTKAEIKDVSMLETEKLGCPRKGTVNVLVIPTEFKDAKAADYGYSISAIQKAFNSKTAGDLPYYSVAEYFELSSYNQLHLNFDVLDQWMMPTYGKEYYQDLYGGEQYILDELLVQLDQTMDLSKYDSDQNGTIDAIVMMNTMEIDYEQELTWAYMDYNYFGSPWNKEYYYTYDGVRAYSYFWCPYDFLKETSTGYDGAPTNTYTLIHEFSHILGADDYYDTSYLEQTTPLLNQDVMDEELGDHNPFTKFNFGWITSSRLVTTKDSITLSLQPFETTGDTILLATAFDEQLGIYQEYYVLMYYSNVGLNQDCYFSNQGILMYHVNASLMRFGDEGHLGYKLLNNNTSKYSVYGSEANLIEFMLGNSGILYKENESSKMGIKDSFGRELKYSFKVDSIKSSEATITFEYKG